MGGCKVRELSACQNICQDFGWITSLTEWLRNLAIVAGVVFAGLQLNSWKREAKATRRAQAAEDLITAAAEVDIALRYIRSPWGQSPPADDDHPQSFEWRERLQRVESRKEDFEKLRHAQVRVEAFVGNPDADAAVSELMDVRQEVWASLGSLVARQEYAERTDPSLREFYESLRWKVWGTYSERDQLGERQNSAIRTLERELYPIVRFER